jgi:uncharacterized protein YggU (UPF0235/DUF167 family)
MAKLKVVRDVERSVVEAAVRASDAGVRVVFTVKPRASKVALTKAAAGGLCLAVTAPPVDGAANAAVIEAFAVLLSVSKSAVVITRGESARDKEILVEGLTVADAINALAG